MTLAIEEEKREAFLKVHGDRPELHVVPELVFREYTLTTFIPETGYAQFRERGNSLGGTVVEYAKQDGVPGSLRRLRSYSQGFRRIIAAELDYQQSWYSVEWTCLYDQRATSSIDPPTFASVKLLREKQPDEIVIAGAQYKSSSALPVEMELPLGDTEDLKPEPEDDLDPRPTITIQKKPDIDDPRINGWHIFDNRQAPVSRKLGVVYAWEDEFEHPSLGDSSFRFLAYANNLRIIRVAPGGQRGLSFTFPMLQLPSLEHYIRGDWRQFTALPIDYPVEMQEVLIEKISQRSYLYKRVQANQQAPE